MKIGTNGGVNTKGVLGAVALIKMEPDVGGLTKSYLRRKELLIMVRTKTNAQGGTLDGLYVRLGLGLGLRPNPDSYLYYQSKVGKKRMVSRLEVDKKKRREQERVKPAEDKKARREEINWVETGSRELRDTIELFEEYKKVLLGFLLLDGEAIQKVQPWDFGAAPQRNERRSGDVRRERAEQEANERVDGVLPSKELREVKRAVKNRRKERREAEKKGIEIRRRLRNKRSGRDMTLDGLGQSPKPSKGVSDTDSDLPQQKKREEVWCMVVSKARNTRVVWTWKENTIARTKKRAIVGLGAVQPMTSPGAMTQDQAKKEPRNLGKVKSNQRIKRKNTVTVVGNRRKAGKKIVGLQGRRSKRERGGETRALKTRKRSRYKFKKAVGVLVDRGVGVHVRREGSGIGSKGVRNELLEMTVRSRGNVEREAHNGCKGKAKRRL
jgi:hypothetical protein